MSAIPQSVVSSGSAAPAAVRRGEISRRLLEPLGMVAARARFLAILRAMFQCVVVTGGVWLAVVLLLGSVRALPVWVAAGCAVVAWAVLAAGAFFFFRPALRHQGISDAARLSDTAIPENHERLSSAIELMEENDPRFHGSPELIAVLLRQAEHAAEALDPAAIVSGRSVFRWFLGVVPVCLAWMMVLIVLTPAVGLGLERLFQPWRAATALPTATLEVDPGNVTVAQGESVTINLAVTPVGAVSVGGEKAIKHATLTRRYSAGGANEDVSSEMEPTGNRTFRAIFDNVQQTFSYRVSAEGSASPTYAVTVQQRPAANSIQVDYTYPAYTHRPAHTETTRDGGIDALVGSVVKLTIDMSEPLKSAQLSITDNTPYPSTMTLTPAAGNATRYTTEFTVRKSTDYRLHLINQRDLENSDTQPRPIVARLDAPPQVSIVSPADGALKVRAEDAVPIKYTATDDFTVTRIDLLTQVDDQPAVITAVPGVAAGQTSVSGLTTLSVRDTVGSVARGALPKRISYQFRVTDNREPERQTGLSTKQVLLIDREVAPLAERQDAQAARTLGEAVERANSSLADAQGKLDGLRQTAAGRALTEGEKQQMGEARRDLDNAAKTLQSAADKSNDSRLSESARAAKAIADQPIREAGENTAASQLAADQPDARGKSLDAASKEIVEARQKLDALGRDIGAKAKDQPLAHELEWIAAEQRRIADGLAQRPNDPALLQQQRQLQQDLEKVIQDHPELQKPAAAAAQAQTDDLAKKLEALKQSQQPLNQSATNQKQAALSQDQLNELAKKQDALNQKMQQFASDQNGALRQAGAKTPGSEQTGSIPKDLQSRNLPSAAQAQNASAAQMEEAAQRLENEARRQHDPAAQNTAEHAAQTAKETEGLKDQAEQLRQQIEEAQKNHNPPTRPSDPANQQATKLAEQLRREAQQMGQSAANRQAAKQAGDEADAAKRDAAQGNAASAQQHLATAASALADAARQQQQAASPGNAAKDPAQAAAQARQLAQQQRDLANQTQQTDQSLASAQSARDNAQQTAQQQQALAEKMDEAAKSAKALQQQTKGAAPDLSQRAGETAQSLQKAAAAQRAAAQANQAGDASKAASQQQQAQRALSSAQQSMGSPAGGSQASGGSPGAASGSQQSGGMGRPGAASPGGGPTAAQAVQAARNAQSQAASGNPGAARQAADQLAQASQQLLTGSGAAGGSPSAAGAAAASGSGSGATPMAGGSGNGPSSGNSAPSAMGVSPSGAGKISIRPAPGGVPPLPKSVEEIGVSPSDWARLPANTQQQLLNSAQQSGPPAYRDMIKNYYSRIAHLDDNGAAK
jgi:hypothetical protein